MAAIGSAPSAVIEAGRHHEGVEPARRDRSGLTRSASRSAAQGSAIERDQCGREAARHHGAQRSTPGSAAAERPERRLSAATPQEALTTRRVGSTRLACSGVRPSIRVNSISTAAWPRSWMGWLTAVIAGEK